MSLRFRITTNPGTVLSDLNNIASRIGGSGGSSKPALEAGAKAGLAEMQAKVPVRTGFLRSTLYADVKDKSLEIGGKADYTAAVEFGHKRYPIARPFVRPGAEVAMKAIQEALQKGV